MALLLRHEDVCASVTMTDAIAAMEDAFREEGEGGVLLPPRINMKAGKGWLRIGPVSLERSGWMGFKAMNLAPGHGVRYQVHLYRASSGELLAIMDAQHLTTLRVLQRYEGVTGFLRQLLSRVGQLITGAPGFGSEVGSLTSEPQPSQCPTCR